MATKHLSDEQIAICAEHMNSSTTIELPHDIRQHLKACDQCAHEVLMVASTIEDIEDSPLQTNILPHKKSNKNHWLAIAASVAIILSATYYIFSDLKLTNNLANNNISKISNDSNKIILNHTPQVKTQKTIDPNINSSDNNKPQHLKPAITPTSKPNTELLAYAPNTQLEKLSDRYTSGTLRGDEIKIITPGKITGKPGIIKLEWNNETKQLLILEFFNNKGEKLFEAETIESSFSPNKLQNNGLYYWKLINEDFDLLFCGKIIL